MAEIKKSVIGKLSGKLGDVVFRNYGKKTIVCVRQSKYKSSKSKKSRDTKSKFGFTTLLATNAIHLPDIKSVWMYSKFEGRSAYTKLIKFNAPFSASDGLTLNNVFTPPGKYLKLISFAISKSNLSVQYSLSDNKSDKLSLPYSANIMLFLYHPKSKINAPDILVLSENIAQSDSLTISFNRSQQSIIEKYSDCILFLALTKKFNSKYEWTSTVSAISSIQ